MVEASTQSGVTWCASGPQVDAQHRRRVAQRGIRVSAWRLEGWQANCSGGVGGATCTCVECARAKAVLKLALSFQLITRNAVLHGQVLLARGALQSTHQHITQTRPGG